MAFIWNSLFGRPKSPDDTPPDDKSLKSESTSTPVRKRILEEETLSPTTEKRIHQVVMKTISLHCGELSTYTKETTTTTITRTYSTSTISGEGSSILDASRSIRSAADSAMSHLSTTSGKKHSDDVAVAQKPTADSTAVAAPTVVEEKEPLSQPQVKGKKRRADEEEEVKKKPLKGRVSDAVTHTISDLVAEKSTLPIQTPDDTAVSKKSGKKRQIDQAIASQPEAKKVLLRSRQQMK